jgi:hypothetical protein
MIDTSMLPSLALAAAAVSAGPILGARIAPSYSRLAVAAAAFHPLLVVGLFYSLALHMHRRLGGWPERIGDAGFPDDLVAHANIAKGAFGALLLGALLVLPMALVFCACVPAARSSLRYLGIYGFLSVGAIGATQLAPAPFLCWWWD